MALPDVGGAVEARTGGALAGGGVISTGAGAGVGAGAAVGAADGAGTASGLRRTFQTRIVSSRIATPAMIHFGNAAGGGASASLRRPGWTAAGIAGGATIRIGSGAAGGGGGTIAGGG